MDKKEHLKSMLTNIVHDRNEEATVDFHNYLQAKMREVINPAVEVKSEKTDTTDE
jgi:hypothetical protein